MTNRRMRTQCVPGPLLSFGRRGLGTRLARQGQFTADKSICSHSNLLPIILRHPTTTALGPSDNVEFFRIVSKLGQLDPDAFRALDATSKSLLLSSIFCDDEEEYCVLEFDVRTSSEINCPSLSYYSIHTRTRTATGALGAQSQLQIRGW